MIVQRAGDVIPQIVGPAGPHAAGHEAVPDADATARSAASTVVKPEGEAMHRCPNRACPSRGLETLINWVEAAADIEGVGEQFVRRLWDQGLVRSMPDLYRLTEEQLLELDGFGEISAAQRDRGDRARRERTIPFSRVLFGLNIPEVGWVTAQNLARHFGTSTGCSPRARRSSSSARGSAPSAPRRSSSGSPTRRTARSSRSCAQLGLRFAADEGDRPEEGPLTGTQYVITGTLESFSARAGEGGARGARREGLRQRLEEDDRRLRRREPGLEGREGRGGRGADSSSEADLQALLASASRDRSLGAASVELGDQRDLPGRERGPRRSSPRRWRGPVVDGSPFSIATKA